MEYHKKTEYNNIEPAIIKSNISKKNNEDIWNNYQMVKIECRNEYLNTHNDNRHYYNLEDNLIFHKITKT